MANRTPTTGAEEGEGQDGEKGQKWGSAVEFLMSCIAMSVGLGNIWRFPFTAYENGGGAFLIPYIVVLLLIGKPLYYLEMSLGQFTSNGCGKVWNMIPALKGLGVGQVYASAVVVTYYCSLMAFTLFFLFSSFSATLPWAQCGDWLNKTKSTAHCVDSKPPEDDVVVLRTNESRSSTELFFKEYVLMEPKNINDGIGMPHGRLCICLATSWLFVLLVMSRGVQSSGKAAYFLALFPYVVLIILFIRGVTLPGAVDGILFFITPKWEKLLDPSVWYAAVGQAFFSLSVCFGTLIAYSSCNDFNHNIHRDAIIVTSMDLLTSLLAGCTIFAILGNLMHELNVKIEDVVNGGTGLAFISYPDAITKFDVVPQLFAVLFFLMLFVLGIGCAVAYAGAVVTIVCDKYPDVTHGHVVIIACTFGFLGGLAYVTPGGQFVLNLVDYYAVTYVVFVMAVMEMIGVAWVYGVGNFCEDIEFMLGHRVGVYWRLCWGIITPLFLLAILVYSLVQMKPLTYMRIDYPVRAHVAGFVLLALGLLPLPIGVVIEVTKARRNMVASGSNERHKLWQAFKQSFQPNELWRPKQQNNFTEWQEFKAKRARQVAALHEPKWRGRARRFTGFPLLPKELSTGEV